MYQIKSDTEKIIIGIQYFLYFGVLGIYLPFFNLYCYNIGFSGFEIGLLSASRTLVMVVFSLIWSFLADQFQARKKIYLICHFISFFIWNFYLFTADFREILIITICYSVFYAPIISFLEAFTMDFLNRAKNKYGKIRLWGSVSFIMMVLLLGKVIDLFSIKIILILISCGSFILAVFAAWIPDSGNGKKKHQAFEFKSMFNHNIIIFLISSFLMLVSHGAYYGFFSIHLQTLGFSPTFIGFAWALATFSEILVMFKSEKLFNHFSMDKILLFSFGGAVLRWVLLLFSRSPMAILLTQLLHSITYGTFHMASILYIDAAMPKENKTLGQAVNNSVTYGLGLMLGFFISGILYETVESFSLFGISSLIALLAGLIFKLFHRNMETVP